MAVETVDGDDAGGAGISSVLRWKGEGGERVGRALRWGLGLCIVRLDRWMPFWGVGVLGNGSGLQRTGIYIVNEYKKGIISVYIWKVVLIAKPPRRRWLPTYQAILTGEAAAKLDLALSLTCAAVWLGSEPPKASVD